MANIFHNTAPLARTVRPEDRYKYNLRHLRAKINETLKEAGCEGVHYTIRTSKNMNGTHVSVTFDECHAKASEAMEVCDRHVHAWYRELRQRGEIGHITYYRLCGERYGEKTPYSILAFYTGFG